MSWDPARYLQYEDARLRPALDLIARIPLAGPREIVDLGCGAGNVARHLAERWPDSRVTGVDGDAAMLAKARASTADDDRFRWIEADIGVWRAVSPPDLLFSNAALHWLDGHETLLPRLLDGVAEGGVLAVQMPDNFQSPSHALIAETACSARWRERLAAIVRPAPVAEPARYHGWLAPHARSLDLWRTEYLQDLAARQDGEHPMVAWLRGSWLIPFLAALEPREREPFVADYAVRVERACPRRADGSVLFPFRRLFIVAVR